MGRWWGLALGLLVLSAAAACAGPEGAAPSVSPAATVTASPASPSPTPAQSGRASAAPSLPDLLALLECDGPASEMGGRADDFGPDGSGTTPETALAAWLQSNPFVIPRDGYERIANDGYRALYAYRVAGEVKVIVSVSPEFGPMVGGDYTVEELRACDPMEFGADVDFGPSERVWSNAAGTILRDFAGPEHCGWQTARLLHVQTVPGRNADTLKQYVRDPQGVLEGATLLSKFAEGVELPADAEFSGYRAGDVELWFVPADDAAYVVGPEGVERWPRADPIIGCS